MGLLYTFKPESEASSAWLLESFRRRFSTSHYDQFQFNGQIARVVEPEPEVPLSRDEYMTRLYTKIQWMLRGRPVARGLNQDPMHLVKFPSMQLEELVSPPRAVMNIYWDLHQDAFFNKQTVMNDYLEEEPQTFLCKPSTELVHLIHSDSCGSPESSDASRKSRIKKRISTELLLESFACDKSVNDALEEEEQQMHLIIAILEDMLFEQTGNARLINYYRGVCGLS